MRIGAYGVLTPEDARDKATLKLAAVLEGRDPLIEREGRRAMPTVREWVDRYMEGVKQRKKSATADKRYLEGIACERWGNQSLDAITVGDLERVMEDLAAAGHRIAANRFLASIRACLQAAWRAGVLKENPGMKVKAYRENAPRARVLSDEEYERFLGALAKERDQYIRAAFQLLIETGARKSEVLRAKWQDLDLDAETWRIPSPKAGHPQVVPLARSTVAMLRRLPRQGEWIIPGGKSGKPRVELRDQWADLKKRAKLGDDVTIHDLRRTFGQRVAKATNLHVASKLLRHSNVRITERVYAPLDLKELRKATEKMAKVLPMKSKKAIG
jgi:integrase